MKKFGSLSGIKNASHDELVQIVGEKRASLLDALK